VLPDRVDVEHGCSLPETIGFSVVKPIPEGRHDRPHVAAFLGGLTQIFGPPLVEAVGEAASCVTLLGAGDAVPPEAEVLATMATRRQDLGPLLTEQLRWVHVLGTGVDGFPFDLLEDRTLTCSRGASGVAIAEFVLAAMLTFEKQLPATWINSPPSWLGAASLGGLAGRSLGPIGLGVIGSGVATRALAFDMTVRAFRRSGAEGPSGVTVMGDLHEMLSVSDHVVIAVPATPATRRLVDTGAFSAMRDGVHLVNIARGSIVDQTALIEALDGGKVALATLDVVDPEPLPPGDVLYSHPKVRLSPHVSWSGPATAPMTLRLFVENLQRYGAGRELAGVVNVAEGY
jgi:phosphoglycerate dehydrogenase-like enzyme